MVLPSKTDGRHGPVTTLVVTALASGMSIGLTRPGIVGRTNRFVPGRIRPYDRREVGMSNTIQMANGGFWLPVAA